MVHVTGYGWVQNISSDLTLAEPQSDITAVEGETVSLTIFFTKFIVSAQFTFRFNVGGTATGI